MSLKKKFSDEPDKNTESEADYKKKQQQNSGVTYRGVYREKSPEKVKSPEEKDKQVQQQFIHNMPIKITQNNFAVRTVWTLVMLLSFIGIIAAGHVYCAIMILLINFAIYKEIISLRRNYEKEKQIPLFFTINWYFFIVAVVYSQGKLLSQKLQNFLQTHAYVNFFINYLNIICFMMYVGGFLLFVLTLKKGYYRYQFHQFAWTHVGIILVVFQCSAVSINLYEGIIWFIIPSLLVISNDIFAYIFGSIFGRTKLIQLSPKKTWEGFIGGFFSSMLVAIVFSLYLSKIPQLICPQTQLSFIPFDHPTCETPLHFVFKERQIPELIANWIGIKTVMWSEFQTHILIMSVFASLIAPFGGFFASGFKRAMKIKDFADIIPGHGGLTDRMDCQLLMGMFSYVYIHQVVLSPINSLSSLTNYITQLETGDQVIIYKQLANMLLQKNMTLPFSGFQ